MRRVVLFAFPLFFLTTLSVPAGKDLDDYLTKEGRLKHVLEFLDVQGGFAGFTGTLLSVQPDGSWKRSSVLPKNSKVLHEGSLNNKQVRELAAALSKYDLLHLTDSGKPGANPHNISLTFGKHSSELRLKAGEKLPRPDDSVAGRNAGIVRAIQGLCPEKAAGKK
jgi:hypothetical protein